MKRLSLSYQFMLLSAAVLAVYYPTQFAQISLVDDAEVISGLLNCGNIPLADVFVPRNAAGGYYRPLVVASYLLDRKLWFLDERLMHFEWMVAHLLNGVFVFFICREAVRLASGKDSTYLPLAAGLLFSLHPIATESVNWISGRTDIMMGNLVLTSAYFLLRHRRAPSPLLLVVSALSALLALLAKEAAFGWLPGFILILMYRPGEEEEPQGAAGDKPVGETVLFAIYYGCAFLTALFFHFFWLVLIVAVAYFFHIVVRQRAFRTHWMRRRLFFLLCAMAATAALFLLVRKVAFTSDMSKIGNTIRLMGSDPNYTVSLFTGATGFYLKKFFLPLPLNFFIREVDPLYELLGIAVLLGTLRLLVSRRLEAVMALAGLFLMLPALPFAFGTIAWTAYAERYIYLSTAFWVVALCLWAGRMMQGRPRLVPIFSGLTIALSLLSAAVTFSRNRLWLTNVGIMGDTVAKSPTQKKLHDIYMYALLQAGRVEEAKKVYRNSCSIHDIFYDDSADLIMGGQLIREGRRREALRLYQDALHRCKFHSDRLLTAALKLVRQMKEDAVTKEESRELSSLEREYDGRLRSRTGNTDRTIKRMRGELEGVSSEVRGPKGEIRSRERRE